MKILHILVAFLLAVTASATNGYENAVENKLLELANKKLNPTNFLNLIEDSLKGKPDLSKLKKIRKDFDNASKRLQEIQGPGMFEKVFEKELKYDGLKDLYSTTILLSIHNSCSMTNYLVSDCVEREDKCGFPEDQLLEVERSTSNAREEAKWAYIQIEHSIYPWYGISVMDP